MLKTRLLSSEPDRLVFQTSMSFPSVYRSGEKVICQVKNACNKTRHSVEYPYFERRKNESVILRQRKSGKSLSTMWL